MFHNRLYATLCAVALSIGMLVGCGGGNSNTKTDNTMTAGAPPNAAAIFERCAQWLPAETMAFAIVDVPYLLNIYRMSGLVPADWDASTMNRDLGNFSSKRLGIDITKIDWVAVGFSPDTEFAAIFVGGNLGDLTLKSDTRKVGSLTAHRVGEDDIALIKTDKPDMILYVFEQEHLKKIDSVKQGQATSLAKSTNKPHMDRVLQSAGSNRIVLVGHMPAAIGDDIAQELQMTPPNAGAISFGESTSAAIQGDPESLKALRKLFVEQRAMVRQELGQEMTALDQSDTVEGLLLILAYHLLEPAGDTLTPELKGDMMTLKLSAASGAIVTTAMLGGAGMFMMLMPSPMMMHEPPSMVPAQPSMAPEPMPVPQ